jgi:hypothetical protein
MLMTLPCASFTLFAKNGVSLVLRMIASSLLQKKHFVSATPRFGVLMVLFLVVSASSDCQSARHLAEQLAHAIAVHVFTAGLFVAKEQLSLAIGVEQQR